MIFVVILGSTSEESLSCTPNKWILLSNCSFRYAFHGNETTTTIDQRRLSMVVPYALNETEEEDLLISIKTHRLASKPLIRLNLNLIECANYPAHMHWTSLESSSTITGEFVRTTLIENRIMYLPAGITYLKNFTTLDCSSQTLYRTDEQQVFQLDLRIESTLNDFCSHEHSCYPRETYQCHSDRQRCACREPFQSYRIKDQYPICIHAVPTLDQCTGKHVRCFEWCHVNSSAPMCLCPEDLATKKISVDDRGTARLNCGCLDVSFLLAYCESRTHGMCDSVLRCPFDELCIHGRCESGQKNFYQILSSDIILTSIVVSSLALLLLSIIFGVSVCILRRHRRKTYYHAPLESLGTTKEPTLSDYDNVTYEALRHQMQFSSSDDNDSSAMTSSEQYSYEPKVVFFGGEQQLTAIFAWERYRQCSFSGLFFFSYFFSRWQINEFLIDLTNSNSTRKCSLRQHLSMAGTRNRLASQVRLGLAISSCMNSANLSRLRRSSRGIDMIKLVAGWLSQSEAQRRLHLFFWIVRRSKVSRGLAHQLIPLCPRATLMSRSDWVKMRNQYFISNVGLTDLRFPFLTPLFLSLTNPSFS